MLCTPRADAGLTGAVPSPGGARAADRSVGPERHHERPPHLRPGKADRAEAAPGQGGAEYRAVLPRVAASWPASSPTSPATVAMSGYSQDPSVRLLRPPAPRLPLPGRVRDHTEPGRRRLPPPRPRALSEDGPELFRARRSASPSEKRTAPAL